MILATDVGYDDARGTALAAGVTFLGWRDAAPRAEHALTVEGVAPYEPGAFYKRELPCLLALLAEVGPGVALVVVDGYVDLGPDHPGLGRHLFEALGRRIPVVGIAKTHFAGTNASEVLRGGSQSPLFVTVAGAAYDEAAAVEAVRSMHGPHRIPTLLKRVDALSRGRA